MKANLADIIYTKRLLLRKFRMTDINDYWDVVTHSKIDPTYGWSAYTSKQKATESLAKEMKKKYLYAIVEKDSNRVIGSIELKRYTRDNKLLNLKVCRGCREITYLLHEKYWAKGIMPEALKAVVEYAFVTLDIPEIVIRHAEANVPSGKVQEELGFKIVDRTKNFCLWGPDEEPTACIYRKMTQNEYFQIYVRTSNVPVTDPDLI